SLPRSLLRRPKRKRPQARLRRRRKPSRRPPSRRKPGKTSSPRADRPSPRDETGRWSHRTGGLFSFCAKRFVAKLVGRAERCRRPPCLADQSIAGPSEEYFAMAEERDEDQFDNEGKGGQQPTGQQGQQTTGQQGQQGEFGQRQGEQAGGLGSEQTMSGQKPSDRGGEGSFGGQSASG